MQLYALRAVLKQKRWCGATGYLSAAITALQDWDRQQTKCCCASLPFCHDIWTPESPVSWPYSALPQQGARKREWMDEKRSQYLLTHAFCHDHIGWETREGLWTRKGRSKENDRLEYKPIFHSFVIFLNTLIMKRFLRVTGPYISHTAWDYDLWWPIGRVKRSIYFT